MSRDVASSAPVGLVVGFVAFAWGLLIHNGMGAVLGGVAFVVAGSAMLAEHLSSRRRAARQPEIQPGMVTANDLGASDLRFLPAVERRRAARQFAAALAELTRLHPDEAESNRSKALNFAVYGLGLRWLRVTMPLIVTTGAFWSFRDSAWQITVASVLTVISTAGGFMALLRRKQALQLWREPVTVLK